VSDFRVGADDAGGTQICGGCNNGTLMNPDLGCNFLIGIIQIGTQGADQIFDACQCLPGVFKIGKIIGSQCVAQIKKLIDSQHVVASILSKIVVLLKYYTMRNRSVSTKNKKAKPVRYTGAFNLRDGGIVTAYEQSNPKLTFSQQFERIESIPVQVMFASSVESGEGDADHLVDGNPATYWHTMWSVTVANYPHWVDFDCQTTKNIKGFTYLPRQDSNNGNIRNYRIQVSQDGKTWSSAIHEGQFENNRNEKRVIFDKPVRARYLRFTALSSQDGQDFATGAEFSILEN
jgi:hypothetical protein